MRIITIILLGTLVGLLSCKKYDEGRNLSLRSKNRRIAGIWRIDTYTIDGADSLAAKNFETQDYMFGLKKCGGRLRGCFCPTCTYGRSRWEIKPSRDNYMRFLDIPPISPFNHTNKTSAYVSSLWEIKRLTNSEMVLESLPSYSKRVIITLSKINDDKPCIEGD